MDSEIKEENGNVVIYLKGDIDLEKSPLVRKLLLENIKDKPVVISLEEVDYIDSSGVASFVEALQTCKGKNLGFAMVSLSPKVKRVLEVARLDKVFPIYDGVADVPA